MSHHEAPSNPIATALNDAEFRWIHPKVTAIAAFGLICDGYDFQATAYAAPLIRQEWQLDPKAHEVFMVEQSSWCPMGRMGDPYEDIAPVIAFLVSDEARYMTGNTLHVDGGGHINGVPWAPDLGD